MGQTLSSETLSISGGDGYRYWVGMTMKPSEVGCKKTVYKGVLLGYGPRQGEKVVAKAFTDIPGTKESWKFELNKADVTKQLAAKFVQEYASLFSDRVTSLFSVRVVIPGIVQMDRVSNLKKWLADKDDGRGLTQDEWISVEEFIPGKMGRFCPWSTKHTEDNVESEHMQAFSHFTYKCTGGDMVACDFQGVYDDTSSQYIFTDSTIHSTYKLYGLFDHGENGISEFFKLHKCNEICSDWPRPTPLTPPPPFDAACNMQQNLTPASEFENIIFPAHVRDAVTHGAQGSTRSGVGDERRRHRSEHHQRQMQTEVAWFGNSIDSHHSERNFNGGRSSVMENIHAPPTYENLAALHGLNSEPPPYESLVTPRDTRKQLKSRKLLPSGAMNGSLDHLSNVSSDSSREYHSFRSRKRSATCPLLHEECHCPSLSGTSWMLDSQQTNMSPVTESIVFYSEEAPPGVPSAPPFVPSAPPFVPSAPPVVPSAPPVVPSAPPVIPSAPPVMSSALVVPSAPPEEDIDSGT